jgi:mRNA interferase HigB
MGADLVGERIVFHVGGNKYRLVVLVDFRRHGLLVRFVGTHAEYDRIEVRTI